MKTFGVTLSTQDTKQCPTLARTRTGTTTDSKGDDMNECPKCGAGMVDITFGDMQPTSDCLIIDVLANCQRCGAELNLQYNLFRIWEDI